MLLPASKLNSFPGRVARPRVVGGRLRPVGDRQWRERNPWLLLEDGYRTIRGFVQRLEVSRYGAFKARFEAGPQGAPRGRRQRGRASRLAAAARVPGGAPRRAWGHATWCSPQPPVHWSAENLAFAYLASSLALGLHAAMTLPLDAVFETGRPEVGASGRATRPSCTGRSRRSALALGSTARACCCSTDSRQARWWRAWWVRSRTDCTGTLRDVTFRESGQDITGPSS
ncbi:MAG: hypothetical protein U0667_06125 [Chloroflexota bacterium]